MRSKIIISISIVVIALSIYNGYTGYKSVNTIDGPVTNKQAIPSPKHSSNKKAPSSDLDSSSIPLSSLDKGTFLNTRLLTNTSIGDVKAPQDSFLNGIIYSDNGDNIAIVDNQPLKVWDSAFGGTIIEIQKRYIVIKYISGNIKTINYTNKRKLK